MIQEEIELLHSYLNGTLSEADFARLQSLLRESADARRMLRDLSTVDAKLQELAATNPATLRLLAAPAAVPSQVDFHPARVGWYQWRPLAAAAAGLAVGLFGASVVFAYVVPLARSITLLDDSFEGSTKLASKVPLEPGVWRGDHAEVVGAEHDVKPGSGQRMLRFLRADFQGKPRASGGHIADLYRLVDLRGQRHEFSDGGAVVQASASVTAMPFPDSEKFGCAISIFALDAESLPESASYIGTALENDANAMARSSRTKLDRDPSSWQRLTTEMRLPANTEFLVVRLHINQLFESDGSSVFTGSYADDVRVVLTPRSPLP